MLKVELYLWATMATSYKRQSSHFSEGKGSPHASAIVIVCQSYLTGFETPSITIAKGVFGLDLFQIS